MEMNVITEYYNKLTLVLGLREPKMGDYLADFMGKLEHTGDGSVINRKFGLPDIKPPAKPLPPPPTTWAKTKIGMGIGIGLSVAAVGWWAYEAYYANVWANAFIAEIDADTEENYIAQLEGELTAAPLLDDQLTFLDRAGRHKQFIRAFRTGRDRWREIQRIEDIANAVFHVKANLGTPIPSEANNIVIRDMARSFLERYRERNGKPPLDQRALVARLPIVIQLVYVRNAEEIRADRIPRSLKAWWRAAQLSQE